MRFRRTATGAALVLAVVTAPLAYAADYPPPSNGQGTVSPSRIAAGECAVFSGGEFAPGAEVAVTDNRDARGTATADADGTFQKTLCYAASTPPGRHVLKGTGASGHGATAAKRTVTAVLYVEGVSESPAAAVAVHTYGSGVVGLPQADTESDSNRGSLAFTGFPALAAALLGVLLVGVGSLVLAAGERRHRRRRLV